MTTSRDNRRRKAKATKNPCVFVMLSQMSAAAMGADAGIADVHVSVGGEIGVVDVVLTTTTEHWSTAAGAARAALSDMVPVGARLRIALKEQA